MQDDTYTKKIILPVVLCLFFLLLLVFFLTHSFIRVDVPSDTQDSSVTLMKNGSQDPPRKISKGLNLLPTGSYSVDVTSGISITKFETSVNPFRITKLTATATPQQKAKKIARGASECLFGNPSAIMLGDIFSYECFNPQSIARNQYQDASIKTTLAANLETSLDVSNPYQNGLISIGNGEGGNALTYIDEREVRLRSLGDITKNENDTASYKLASVGSKIFILDTNQKAIFVLDGFDASPRKITLDTKNEPISKIAVFRVFGDKFYISTITSESSNGAFQQDSFEKGVLYIYNIDGGKPLKAFPLSKQDGDVSNLMILDDQTIAIMSLKQETTIYNAKGGKLHKEYTIPNTSKIAANNRGKLYVLIDGQIFAYNSQKKLLNLAFGSANVKVTQLQNVGGLILFNGYAETDSSSINQTYVLQNENIDDAKYRLEDRLPYGDVVLPIEWMDYFGNSFHIVVSLDSLRNDLNSATGGFVFDQNEYNQKVQVIQEKLAKDGFTADKYTITFAPY